MEENNKAEEAAEPLSIAVGVVINQEDQILLMQRKRGDYVGLWALPGGKIESNEHLDQAAVREMKEETNLSTEFKQHLAVVSEHLLADGELDKHFLLHICQLRPKSEGEELQLEAKEGKQLRWHSLSDLDEIGDKIVPSDVQIIDKIVRGSEKGYYRCVLDKIEAEHHLDNFERIADFE